MTNNTDDRTTRRKRDRISQSSAPPSFPFYWRDWLASFSVRAMTKEQRGGYIDYLCHTQGADHPGVQPEDTVRAMAGFTEEEWRRHRDAFRRCFHVRRDGMWVQKRVVDERAAQKRRYKRAVNAGKEGARKRGGDNKLTRGAGAQAGAELLPQPYPYPDPDPEKLEKQVVPSPNGVARAGAHEAGTAGSQAISNLLQSVLGSTRMPGVKP
jgi:uncharacterized protein YdaU (DUF1376 family)